MDTESLTAQCGFVQRRSFSLRPQTSSCTWRIWESRGEALLSPESSLEDVQEGARGCRGPGAAFYTHSEPLTSRACTPRGTGELHSWRKEAEELGRAPGLRVQELLPFSREKLQTRPVPDPCFPPAAAPHLSFHSEGVRSAGWEGSEKEGLMTWSSWVLQPKRQRHLWG